MSVVMVCTAVFSSAILARCSSVYSPPAASTAARGKVPNLKNARDFTIATAAGLANAS